MAARGRSAGIHATECGPGGPCLAEAEDARHAWPDRPAGCPPSLPLALKPLRGHRARAQQAAVRLLRRDRFEDAVEALVERADAVDDGQLAMLAIELDHRRGLLVVDLQPLADRVGVVIGTALGLGAAGQAF